MQVILTASDVAAMPTALRQELLAYLASRRKPAAPRRAGGGDAFEGLAVLDRDQAVALVRSVSFGRERQGLRDLLEALADGKHGAAPSPAQLARVLKLDDARRLRRYFAAIGRLLKQVTGDVAPLMRYSRRIGGYLMHPATRASLHEVFVRLARSGESEEPLWA